MNSIVRANDFALKISLSQQSKADAEKEILSVSSIEDLAVVVKSKFGGVVSTTFEAVADEDNALMVHIDGTKLSNGSYSVELTGKVNGHNIRSAEADVFCICEYNGQQSITFKPFEGEEGGVVPMAFCILGDDKPTLNWVNDLKALKEQVEGQGNNAQATAENGAEMMKNISSDYTQKRKEMDEAIKKVNDKLNAITADYADGYLTLTI